MQMYSHELCSYIRFHARLFSSSRDNVIVHERDIIISKFTSTIRTEVNSERISEAGWDLNYPIVTCTFSPDSSVLFLDLNFSRNVCASTNFITLYLLEGAEKA